MAFELVSLNIITQALRSYIISGSPLTLVYRKCTIGKLDIYPISGDC